MKSEKLSFDKIKNLMSRDEMKKIMAGSDGGSGGDPGEPSGGNDGYTQYKCCWSHSPSNCSKCVNCDNTCTCVSGATLAMC